MTTSEEMAKKMMDLLERTDYTRKSVKDIRTAIFKELSEPPSNDIKMRYFKVIKECRLIKAAILYYINQKMDYSLKAEGTKIIEEITEGLLDEIKPLKPTIMDAGGGSKKFRFQDGSEATIENYEQIKNTVLDNILLNKINKLENFYSDALGFIVKVEKQMWQRDDRIGDIDLRRGVNGR